MIMMGVTSYCQSNKIVKIPSNKDCAIFTNEFLKLQRFYESTNDQNKISKCGASGVAQFMPTTWEWIKKKKLIPNHYSINNKSHQIVSQKSYMEYLFNRPWKPMFNRYRATIASYNCGRSKVLKLGELYGKDWEMYLPLETKNYLRKLLP